MVQAIQHLDATLRTEVATPRKLSIDELAIRYRSIASLPERERMFAVRRIVDSEYTMDDADLRERTRNRLLAWLELSDEEARIVGASYDRAMQELKADAAMRRVSMVQSIFLSLPDEEQERLRECLSEAMVGPRLRPPTASSPPKEAGVLSRLRFWRQAS